MTNSRIAQHLGHEEKQGDYERTSFLYEHCLVACALYDVDILFDDESSSGSEEE